MSGGGHCIKHGVTPAEKGIVIQISSTIVSDEMAIWSPHILAHTYELYGAYGVIYRVLEHQYAAPAPKTANESSNFSLSRARAAGPFLSSSSQRSIFVVEAATNTPGQNIMWLAELSISTFITNSFGMTVLSGFRRLISAPETSNSWGGR